MDPGKTVETNQIQADNSEDSNNNTDNTTIDDSIMEINLGEKIGSGSFGEVRRAQIGNSEQILAVKIERKDAENPKLEHEYEIYTFLRNGHGIPKIFLYGTFEENKALVMQLLGKSLDFYHKQQYKTFSVETTAKLALQIIDRIEFVHSRGIVYRDIKPDNFVFGEKDSRTLYLIDFGLSKLYIDPITNEHIPFNSNGHVVGTARYMSINTHYGREQGRRDDLESIGYLLMFFLRGKLPWQNLTYTSKDKCVVICRKKEETSLEELCTGFPEEFLMFLEYSRKLSFSDRPDYAHLRFLFSTVLLKNGFEANAVFDWDKK